MGILELRRDFQDLNRLREIMTILVERGFHAHLFRAKLAHHAKVASRLKHASRVPDHRPEAVRETLEALGPTFVKLGQVLSLRPDLVPHEYCEAFRSLQDHVAPLSYPVIKGVVESELRRPIAKVFRSFSHEPLAAASISQVHEAVLLDGTRVVIKVQRPGVAEVMAKDIDIMRYIASKLDKAVKGIRAGDIVDEFASYTARELDFSFELRSIKKFHVFFKGDPDVVIPAAYEEHSTRKVLVLERISGVRVSDKEALGRARVDLKALGGIGFRATFRQVFELGCFHGDPHPGNLLAVKRPRGGYALAFLDFGIVGFLDEEMQDRLLELLLALDERDVRGVVRTLLRLGERGPGFDEKAFESEISQSIMDWHGTTLREAKMSDMVYQLITSSIRHSLRMPASVILVAKAFVTMEGTGAWLDEDFDISKETAPLLERLAMRRYGPQRLKQDATRAAREFGELGRMVPEAAETLLEKVREGKVEVALDRAEFLRAEADYDLSSSKKSLSITAGAFFLGSAMLAAFAPELTFLSYPLYQVGFALFLVTLLLLIHVSIKTHKYLQREL